MAVLVWLAFWIGLSLFDFGHLGARPWVYLVVAQLLLGLAIGRWWAVPLPLALAMIAAIVLAVGNDPGCVDYCDDYISNDQWAPVVVGVGAVASVPVALGVAFRKFITGPDRTINRKRLIDRISL